jgi:hypothetical protein
MRQPFQGRTDTRRERMLALQPTDLRASEIEALVWSTTNGWADAPLFDLPALLRRIVWAVRPPRRSEASTLARRHRDSRVT